MGEERPQDKDDGPSEQDRANPGDTGTNPSGKSAKDPAEGADDAPPERPGSPEG
jgi:hypothetical protein